MLGLTNVSDYATAPTNIDNCETTAPALCLHANLATHRANHYYYCYYYLLLLLLLLLLQLLLQLLLLKLIQLQTLFIYLSITRLFI